MDPSELEALLSAWFDQFRESLIASAIILVAAFVLAWVLRWAVRRLVEGKDEERKGRSRTARRIVNLLVFVGAVFAILDAFGVELTQVLNYSFMDVGSDNRPLTVGKILTAIAIVLLSVLAGRLLESWLTRVVPASTRQAKANVATLGRLGYYIVVPLGVAVAVSSIGIHLGALLTLGGVFVVAIGFATKNIAENFVSGVILLVERSIKPDDVLEVEGEIIRVTHLGIRTTIGRTREGEEFIIPNALLCGSKVKNYTYRDMQFRIHVYVGVAYDSHLPTVFEVLEKAVEGCDFVLPSPEPRIVLEGFGDNSVNFAVDAWIDDPWGARARRSDIARAVWDALAEAGIVIAFPQRDLHLDDRTLDVLSKLGRSA